MDKLFRPKLLRYKITHPHSYVYGKFLFELGPGRSSRVNIFHWLIWMYLLEQCYPQLKASVMLRFYRGIHWFMLQRTRANVMMTSLNVNIFCVTGHRWVPSAKASDAELRRFLSSWPVPTNEQTVETPVIWVAMALIPLWRHCNVRYMLWKHMKDLTTYNIINKCRYIWRC